jgi:DNA-binding MarR family transcriptional regulator
MVRRKGSVGPTPPAFIAAAIARELPTDLAQPIDLLFALRSCMQRVNAGLAQRLGPDALSPGRMQLMMTLWASKEPVPQTKLVETLQVSRASVSELLETLSREGMIVIHSDPTHGRRLLVELSPQGFEATRTQLLRNATSLRGSFEGLSSTEQRQLITLLRRLCPTPSKHA